MSTAAFGAKAPMKSIPLPINNAIFVPVQNLEMPLKAHKASFRLKCQCVTHHVIPSTDAGQRTNEMNCVIKLGCSSMESSVAFRKSAVDIVKLDGSISSLATFEDKKCWIMVPSIQNTDSIVKMAADRIIVGEISEIADSEEFLYIARLHYKMAADLGISSDFISKYLLELAQVLKIVGARKEITPWVAGFLEAFGSDISSSMLTMYLRTLGVDSVREKSNESGTWMVGLPIKVENDIEKHWKILGISAYYDEKLNLTFKVDSDKFIAAKDKLSKAWGFFTTAGNYAWMLVLCILAFYKSFP